MTSRSEAFHQRKVSAYFLLAELALSRGDGRYVRRLGQLARIGLLVLDDFLLTPPSVIEAKDLLEVIDDRSQVRSTLVVSQLPVETWHPALAGGDPTLADAILDRLLSRIRDKRRYSECTFIPTSLLSEMASASDFGIIMGQ